MEVVRITLLTQLIGDICVSDMSDGTKVSGFLFLPRDGDPSASSPSVDRFPSSEGILVMPPPGGHSEDISILGWQKVPLLGGRS